MFAVVPLCLQNVYLAGTADSRKTLHACYGLNAHGQQGAWPAASSSLQRPPVDSQQDAGAGCQSAAAHLGAAPARLCLTSTMPSARCVAHSTPGVQPG